MSKYVSKPEAFWRTHQNVRDCLPGTRQAPTVQLLPVHDSTVTAVVFMCFERPAPVQQNFIRQSKLCPNGTTDGAHARYF